MSRLMKHALAIAGLSLTMPLLAQPTVWQIDRDHSTALFTVRHLGVSNIHGSFAKVSGTVTLDDADTSKSSVNATIDTTSISTDNENRDKDLRSDHFFDTAKFPAMTFQSKKVMSAGGKTQVLGTLTLHGVSKDVTLDVEGSSKEVTAMGKQRRGYTATTTINRRDFGLTYGGNLPSGDAMVGDDVKITLEVELTK